MMTNTNNDAIVIGRDDWIENIFVIFKIQLFS